MIARSLFRLVVLFMVAVLVVVLALPAASADLAVGDPAPDFELQGSDGKSYSLASFKGQRDLVLAWFPKAFTPG